MATRQEVRGGHTPEAGVTTIEKAAEIAAYWGTCEGCGTSKSKCYQWAKVEGVIKCCPDCAHTTSLESAVPSINSVEARALTEIRAVFETRVPYDPANPLLAIQRQLQAVDAILNRPLAPEPVANPTCPKCRHVEHYAGLCFNMASDNDCSCDHGDPRPTAELPCVCHVGLRKCPAHPHGEGDKSNG